MPTYDQAERFWRDWEKLSDEQRDAFRRAVRQFVTDMNSGRFRKGLRVKAMRGTDRIWEMTWADDGRATFEYGPEVEKGEPHVIWRRIGTHEIFRRP